MSYNSKKSAQSAARKSLGANYAELCTIAISEGKWDFTVNEVLPAAQTALAVVEPVIAEPVIAAVEGEFIPAGEQGSDELSDDETPDEPAAPSMLAGLLGNMTGDVPVVQPAPAPKAEPKVSGLTVEKDRPSQNGVKRPSVGGLCRAVWDACWKFQEQFEAAPTAKEVKAIAEEHGWNVNNASIEYYQWRKYNGISGRVTKAPAKNAEAAQPANFGSAIEMTIVPVVEIPQAPAAYY